MSGSPACADALLRALDVVRGAAEGECPGGVVVEGVGGARVAVAGLADGAGVDHEAASIVERELDRASLAGVLDDQHVGLVERHDVARRDVGVAEQADRPARGRRGRARRRAA